MLSLDLRENWHISVSQKLCTKPKFCVSCWRVRPADCSLGAEVFTKKIQTNQAKVTYPYFKHVMASDMRHFSGNTSTN